MSRYDGLIIPRSYNEYINKTDPVAMSQALQLSGVLSAIVAAGDNKAVKSSAVYEALTNYINKTDAATLQQALQLPGVLSGAVAAGDNKAVTSDAVNAALTDAATILNALQLSGVMSDSPAKGSSLPVKSGGVWNAIHAISHNIPRVTPKDITSYYNDGSLWNRIAGTGGYSLFEDIYVGDYFKMSRAISAYERTGQYQTTGSQFVTIAGLDTMMNNGDQGNGVDYHHAVMVAGQGFGGTQHFGKSRMNATNTTEGGYKASEMNTLVLGKVTSTGSTAADATINQQLYAEFGSHLKTTRELISNALNATGYNRFGSATGCASNWTWISAQAILMSEIEVYGATVWSSSGYDTGTANVQLPLFAFSKQAQNNRSAYWWLKNIADAARFCSVDSGGLASYGSASIAYGGVRPRFIIA